MLLKSRVIVSEMNLPMAFFRVGMCICAETRAVDIIHAFLFYNIYYMFFSPLFSVSILPANEQILNVLVAAEWCLFLSK